MYSPMELLKHESIIGDALNECRRIFKVRNAKYKSAFMKGGAVDNAFQLRHKAIRMLQKVQDYQRYIENPEAYVRGYGEAPEEPNLDDVYDLINYGCFLIICIVEKNWKGTMDAEDSPS